MSDYILNRTNTGTNLQLFKWNTGCRAHFQLPLQGLATRCSHFEIMTNKISVLFCFGGSVAVVAVAGGVMIIVLTNVVNSLCPIIKMRQSRL